MKRYVTGRDNKLEPLTDGTLVLTEAWQPLGVLINTRGSDDVALWLKGLINDSDKIQFRIKCLPTEADDAIAYATQIQTVNSTVSTVSDELYEITRADIEMIIPLGIAKLSPYLQIEIKVLTAGGSPAAISEAYVSFNRG